jgi:hypothetical protein
LFDFHSKFADVVTEEEAVEKMKAGWVKHGWKAIGAPLRFKNLIAATNTDFVLKS